MSPFSLLLLSLLALSGAVLASPRPTFTTNTGPLVKLGAFFIANCSYPTFKPPAGHYIVSFGRDGQSIARLNYTEIDSPEVNSTNRKPVVTLDPHHFRDFFPMELLYSTNWATFYFSPKNSHAHKYDCFVDGQASNALSISVLKKLPSVRITGNVSTKPESGTPFTLTCSVEQFKALPSSTKYSVQFFSKTRGLLVTYGRDLATVEKHTNLTVHHGAQTVAPVWQIDLLDRSGGEDDFWCAFEVELGGGRSTFRSPNWPDRPAIKLYSMKRDESTRMGTCKITEFEPAGKTFSVQFWSDRGPKPANRLATYTVKPNVLTELDTEEVGGWKEIKTGGNSAFPSFNILATEGAPGNESWWCVLGLGSETSKEYREIKSEIVKLL